MDIRKLFISSEEAENESYKSGWNDAVCWLNENYKILDKEKREISIAFDINLSEAKILEILKRESKND